MNTLSEAEEKIAELVWADPGMSSMDAVRASNTKYGWKKSTVFTLIHRMEEKKLLLSEDHRLRMSCSRDEYDHQKASDFVQADYSGSLPVFLTAFMKDRVLSDQEADELEELIRSYRERRK